MSISEIVEVSNIIPCKDSTFCLHCQTYNYNCFPYKATIFITFIGCNYSIQIKRV